ncbi:MAG: hypothetical protein LBK26_01370 [Rickettsiales bacterium]|jgi:hypothetical protein|nr:hypothetical protein [Rickettsiales bacterium]
MSRINVFNGSCPIILNRVTGEIQNNEVLEFIRLNCAGNGIVVLPAIKCNCIDKTACREAWIIYKEFIK